MRRRTASCSTWLRRGRSSPPSPCSSARPLPSSRTRFAAVTRDRSPLRWRLATGGRHERLCRPNAANHRHPDGKSPSWRAPGRLVRMRPRSGAALQAETDQTARGERVGHGPSALGPAAGGAHTGADIGADHPRLAGGRPMRPPDLGPDAFAFRQERDEAERARAPSTIATAKPARKVKRVIDPNDSRPKIRLCANDIERIVNECESALIKANRGLYQRHGSIVFVDSVPALAAHGVKVQVQRISERGEQALQEDFSSAACFEKFDARADDLVLTDPPMRIVGTLLARGGG